MPRTLAACLTADGRSAISIFEYEQARRSAVAFRRPERLSPRAPRFHRHWVEYFRPHFAYFPIGTLRGVLNRAFKFQSVV